LGDFLKVPPGEPVPLSVLELDLPAPTIGWAAGLAEKGIRTVLDDLGRLCVSRGDARRLFEEHREAESRKREMAARQEQLAVEADRAFRAQLSPGIPWYQLPDGVSFAQAAAAAEAEAHPRRTPTRGEWLFGETDTMVFHSLEGEGES
jgi:hypothetical protein